MAKFKVGERAAFKHGPHTHNEIPLLDGQVVTVVSFVERQESRNHIRKERYQGGTWYRVEEAPTWQIHEDQLEKLLGKHQDADLKAAEPLFIHGQLQRWLNPEKEKTLEKSS